jgi:hypothetical protein
VPTAACRTLRAISRVAEPCSSTAEAIVVATTLMSPMVWLMLSIASTHSLATLLEWVTRRPAADLGNGGGKLIGRRRNRGDACRGLFRRGGRCGGPTCH